MESILVPRLKFLLSEAERAVARAGFSADEREG